MLLTLFIFLCLATGGAPQKAPKPAPPIPVYAVPDSTFQLPYRLKDPDQTMKMPRKLEEISGLSWHPGGRYLATVQDEDGIVFLVDHQSGEVEEEIEFWKDGDYEGVETVGDDIYVVKSSGTLYRILQPGGEGQEVEKYNYFLTSDNDVEGLAYDAVYHRLLLACKAEAGEGEEFRLKKAVYSFDLNTFQLEKEPAYVISLEAVQDYLGTKPAIRKLEKLIEFFQPGESEFSFSPSGIAIHPLTGHLYFTSSVGKLLLIMDPGGEILHIEKLDKDVHAQPEGLCFAPDGTLFISNEGKDGSGRIYRFDYHP